MQDCTAPWWPPAPHYADVLRPSMVHFPGGKPRAEPQEQPVLLSGTEHKQQLQQKSILFILINYIALINTCTYRMHVHADSASVIAMAIANICMYGILSPAVDHQTKVC